MDEITRYFPDLSRRQSEQFETMARLYPEWNDKINVISRRDIDNIVVNHILHSLAIAKFTRFLPGTKIIDLGCGGGFPGLPLAVLFPEAEFILIDRTAKKLRVAEDIARQTGISNAKMFHGDAAEYKGPKADFVVSRAVMPLHDLYRLSRRLVTPGGNNPLPNGLITLKGGDISGEVAATPVYTDTAEIRHWFEEPYFETKLVTYNQI